MSDQNIMRPSNSQWSFPIWDVPKKANASGKQKLIKLFDYRKLNEKTLGDPTLPHYSRKSDVNIFQFSI